MFTKSKPVSKSAAQVFDEEIRSAYDQARSAGLSSGTICESLRSLADLKSRRHVLSAPHSALVPQQHDGYGRPIPW